MKKIYCLIVLVYTLCSTCVVFANTDTLKIGVIDGFGIHYNDETDSFSGYVVDYVDKITKYTKSSYNVEYLLCTWENYEDFLHNDTIDLFYPLIPNDIVEGLHSSVNNIGDNVLLLSTKKSNNVFYKDYEQITGKSISIPAVFPYREYLDNFLLENDISAHIYVASDETMYVDNVTNSIYDYCILSSFTLTNELEVVAKLNTTPTYFASNGEKANILDDFDYAINLIHENEYFFTDILYLSYFNHNINDDDYISREDFEYLREHGPYTVGYSTSYSPLSYLNEDGELVGVSIEMLNEIIVESGIEINLVDITTLDDLSVIDISLMAPNYSNGYFEKVQSNPYFHYAYILIEKYDFEGKSNDLGILNFYEIENSTLDIVLNDGSIIEYPNFNAMETAFNSGEIGSMIVTSTVYNKLQNDLKNNYTVTPLDAKLDVTLAFPDDFPHDKVVIFNKLISLLDNVRLEYLFSEHLTALSSEGDNTKLQVVQENFDIVFGSFFIGIISFVFGFVVWQYVQKKRLSADVAIDKAVIACAKTLFDDSNSMSELLKIVCEFYYSEFAYVYERSPNGDVANMIFTYSNGIVSSSLPPMFEDIQNTNWTDILKENNYIFLEDSSKNLEYYTPCDTYLSLDHNTNVLILPLKLNDKVIGVLSISNLKRNTDKFKFLTTISAFISNNLEIKHSKQYLETTVDGLEAQNLEDQAILECIKTLVYDDDLDLSIKNLLEIVCSHFNAERGYILTKKNDYLFLDNEYIYFPSSKPSILHSHKVSYSVVYDWFAKLSKNGTMHITQVASQIPKTGHNSNEFSLLKQGRVSSFLCVPLYRNESITGFLWVDNPLENKSSNDFLKTISAFISNHLNKNALHKKLETLSFSDTLTGLYNRNYYTTFIERKEPYKDLGIIFADVNGLKNANDKLGHEYGDLLLKWSAQFFKNNIDGTIFRIGGDEFVCLMENVSKESFENTVNCLTEKMLSYGDVHISIGSTWDSNVADFEKQVSKADKLMYDTKQKYYEKKALDPRNEEQQLNDFKKSLDKLDIV